MSVSLLDVIQQSARKGTLLASCEPEVKELMHQIDILLSAKQNEGKSQVHGLKNQLQMREREMSSLRVAIQEKNTQIDKMKDDVKRLEQQLRVQSSDHETHLLRLKSELNRLSKSYEKLKSRRGLSEERSSELAALREQLEEMRIQCEAHQSQITHFSHQLGVSRKQETTLQEENGTLKSELEVIREELMRCMSEKEKLKDTITKLESQLKQFQDSVKSRDRKIQSLRTERDEVKKKHKTLLEECQRLQEATVAMSNQNQSYQVGVADLELQLTREQSNLQNCEVERAHLQQQLGVSQELIRNKEKFIQSLDGRYKQKIESETSVLNLQMKELREKLEVLKKHDTSLRDENSKLKERLRRRRTSSNNSSIMSVSSSLPAMTELQNYRAKLTERDQLVSSLEQKVQHLEEQLSEATSVQYSSSINSSGGARESYSPCESKTAMKLPMTSSRDTSLTMEGLPPSPIDRSQTIDSPVTNDGKTQADPIRRVSEHFQLGMRRITTPTTVTPTTNHNNSLLEMFKTSLDSVLTEHFNKIDQSLRNTMEQ